MFLGTLILFILLFFDVAFLVVFFILTILSYMGISIGKGITRRHRGKSRSK